MRNFEISDLIGTFQLRPKFFGNFRKKCSNSEHKFSIRNGISNQNELPIRHEILKKDDIRESSPITYNYMHVRLILNDLKVTTLMNNKDTDE